MTGEKHTIIFGLHQSAHRWARVNGIENWIHGSDVARVLGLDPGNYVAVRVTPSTPESDAAWEVWQRRARIFKGVMT